MPRTKKPAPPAAPAAPPVPAPAPAGRKGPMSASKTSHLFAGKAQKDRGGAVTSERIEEDLDAFRKAGGRIEVLGTTRSLTRIDAEPGVAPPAEAKSASPFAKRKR